MTPSNYTNPCGIRHFSERTGWRPPVQVGTACSNSAVAANTKGDFVLSYYDYQATAQLKVVSYYAQQVGAAHVVATGTSQDLYLNQISLSIRNDRSISAVYFAGTADRALYIAEASAAGEWGPAARIAPVAPCGAPWECSIKARFNQSGDGLIVWQQLEGDAMSPFRTLWSVTRVNGVWSAPTKVALEPVVEGIDLASNERGDAVLVYRVSSAVDTPSQLRVRRCNAAGVWGDVEMPVGESVVGRVAVGISPAGDAVVAWNVFSASVAESYDIWASQTNGRGWSQPSLIGAGAFPVPGRGFALAVGQDIAMITWQDRATRDVLVAQLD